MQYIKKLLTLLLAQAFFVGAALADAHGTADEAKALAEKAAAYIKSAGAEKAFAEFSAKDGKWQDKDLYVFVIGFDGTMLAHGANKALVGKQMIDMKDANGKLFTKEKIEVAKSGKPGWVDYMFTNPSTKKIDAKSAYVVHAPGMDALVAVGIYK